ncbi:Gti1/Pac2 family-domain-containing protein [Xylariaceae sp. FL1019]|nr:Gti1/Pac2 family-domain-containing protein [Xylariaceae sp. FL1019]
METYRGYVRTPGDAIKLFEACRLGLLPRVQRRLSEKERQSIKSGSVFVWDEREAGMRRWTDGKSWSASRVSGSFLTYREMEGKRGSGFGSSRRTNGRSPDSGRVSDEDPDGEPEGYRYKADGLMKQSFSITTSQGQHLHLISYYSRPQPGSPDLNQPSTDPQLRHISPVRGMYPESSLQDGNPPPATTRTPMPPYNNPNGPHDGMWASHPSWMGNPGYNPSWTNARTEPDVRPHPQTQIQSPVFSQPHPSFPAPRPHPPQIHSPGFTKQAPYFEHERLPPPPTYPITGQAPGLSPRSQQLQVQAAQAVLIDPHVATCGRNPHGPLPTFATSGRGPTPPRTHSLSPPRTAGSDGSMAQSSNKPSLSLLLHPTPANSEPSSANAGSASSSPRALAASAHEMSHDVKAIRSLDRKFCI